MSGLRWTRGPHRVTVLTTAGGTISFLVQAYRWFDRKAGLFEWLDAEGSEAVWIKGELGIVIIEQVTE